MKLGIAPVGRTMLAVVTATAMVFAVVFLLADPSARADHVPPNDTVANDGPAGTNDGPYWEDYLAGKGIANASCWKINQDSDEAWVMPSAPAGEDWVLLVVKQGDTNFVYSNPIAGHPYPSVGDNAPGYSHIIVCSVPEGTTTTTAEGTTTTTAEGTTTTTAEGTTTTTAEGTTTTTVEGTTTTTTAEGTTTTIEGTTATTIEGTTTTTTIGDDVLASIVVSISGRCELDGNTGQGVITVNVSVDDGAVVVVRDADGDVVGSLSSDGTIIVPEGASYTWEATPNEGFEFPAGSATSGSIVIETCSNPGALPFTGADTDLFALLAAGVAAAGALLLLVSKSRGDKA